MAQPTLIGPQTLEPMLVERIWGTDTLHDWYKHPAVGQLIGEAWLTAKECSIEESDHTLGELTALYPDAFESPVGEGFPLLIKLLYPREKLSVQVHPNDEQALASLGEPRGKTECWYVLSAEPGAQVAVGFERALSSSQVADAIADGTIEAQLRYLPVKAGDMIFVDAGTVHAIGPGMVVLETQQYSDVTYRLWDYGRPRELHLDAGLAVVRSETAAGYIQPHDLGEYTRLISCQYFTVDRFPSSSASEVALGNDLGLQILIALGSGASVTAEGVTYPLKPGCAVLLPHEGVSYKLTSPSGADVIRIFGHLPGH